MPAGYAPSFAGGPLAALAGRDRELTRYTTPVPGLFLTGGATFPGAGISGAPGRNTARVILREREKAAGTTRIALASGRRELLGQARHRLRVAALEGWSGRAGPAAGRRRVLRTRCR